MKKKHWFGYGIICAVMLFLFYIRLHYLISEEALERSLGGDAVQLQKINKEIGSVLLNGIFWAVTVIVILPLEYFLINRGRKKTDLKYADEMRAVKDYLGRYGMADGTENGRKYVENYIKVNGSAMCFVLIFVIVYLGILSLLDIFSTVSMLILMTAGGMAVVLLRYWRRQEFEQIREMGEEEGKPLEAIWCWSQLPLRRSRKDMNMAVWMFRQGDYEESCTLAEVFWNRRKREKTQGPFYLQYHHLQWKNYTILGDQERAQKHFKCVEKEVARRPGNKYNQKVKAEIENRRF